MLDLDNMTKDDRDELFANLRDIAQRAIDLSEGFFDAIALQDELNKELKENEKVKH